MEAPILSVQNVSKTFYQNHGKNAVTAVENVSFDVKPGEILGLLGPNGAGKTTTLKMAAGLLCPDSGRILFREKSLQKNLSFCRTRMGFLSACLSLEDCFTPEYLFHYFSKLYGLPSELEKKQKEELFQTFEITAFRNRKLAELSTGMKQRVSLAISLINNPDLIIFDEPTNGLDIVSAQSVMVLV